MLRPRYRRRGLRTSRFEPIEPRLVMSGGTAANALFGTAPCVPPAAEVQSAGVPTDDYDVADLARAAADYGLNGAGQTVVVIDSGVAYDHEALGGGFGPGYTVVGGYDFAERDADPYDDGPLGAHGTHVSGIIAGSGSRAPGLASGVDLVVLRVFDDAGHGRFEWVEEALGWVHDHRYSFANPITTVNISIGSAFNGDSPPSWANLEEELAVLHDDGMFITVAAGNGYNTYAEPGLSYPAVSPYVVPVSSVDADGSLSYFSQRDARAIAAPGRSILSTVPDYMGDGNGIDDDFARFSGTSMAAPHVAAAGALVREAYWSAGSTAVTPDEIYGLMQTTADTIHDAATGAGYLRLNLRRALEEVLPQEETPTDLPRVDAIDQRDFAGLAIDASGEWLEFAAAYDGILTVEARFNHAAGDVDFELFDSGGTRLDGSYGWGDYERIDVTVRTGEVFSLHTYLNGGGTNRQVDLRITNLVTRRGDSLLVRGTAGDDHLTFRAGETHRITVGGTGYEFDSAEIRDLHLDGLAGSDAVTLYGTLSDERAVLRVGSAILTGPGYQVEAAGFESVTVHGGGGSDTASLFDSAANDTFVGKPGEGVLYGPGFFHRVLSFDSVGAYATSGGRDRARLFDSAGDDTYVGRPDYGRLFGGGFSNLAMSFDEVDVLASAGGHDRALLYGSRGWDTLLAWQNYARLSGHGYQHRARLFEEIHAHGRGGSGDRAILRDSAVDDHFEAEGRQGHLSGGGLDAWLYGFDRLAVHATSGGTNTADLAAVDYVLSLLGQWD